MLHSLLVPIVLLSAVETTHNPDPKLQTQMTCTIDDQGHVVLEKVTGFDEEDKPIKVEKKEKTVSLPQVEAMKSELAGATEGGYIYLDHSCNIGTTVVQGFNAQANEMFDLFVARNCMDTLINNRLEVQTILKRAREWCGMTLVRPRLRGRN